MRLYHPEKYKVVSGSGESALCTGWSDPVRLVENNQSILNACAIIGALYSPNGINHMIRNLCLNPTIRHLYVWRHEDLSRTEFGSIATSTLEGLWEHGVDKNRKYNNFTLEDEIPLDIFELVRKHVTLHNVSDVPLTSLVLKCGEAEKGGEYMESVSFPDPVVKQPETFSSEKYGWVVRCPSIYEAWTRVIERVDRYGVLREVDGGILIKELHALVWVVTNQKEKYPVVDLPDEVQVTIGAKKEMIDEYINIFLSPEKGENISYTYGERLFAHKGSEANPINQIAHIIQRLKKDPGTRRAYATTFIPSIDASSGNPPCVTGVQVLMGDEQKVNLIATFRSHDMYKSSLPNAFGLHALHNYICEEAGVSKGSLIFISQSAHVYEGEFEEVKKTSLCWRESIPEMTAEGMDQRGACIIRIESGVIVLELKSPLGDLLQVFKGKSADELVRMIGHLDLLGQSGHALDIGVQLARAEMAMRQGVPFVQDKNDIEGQTLLSV